MLFLPLRPSLYGLCPVRLSVPVFNQSKSAQCHQRAHWHFWPTFLSFHSANTDSIHEAMEQSNPWTNLSFHIYTAPGITGVSKGAKMYKTFESVYCQVPNLLIGLINVKAYIHFFSKTFSCNKRKNPSYISFISLNKFQRMFQQYV